MPERFALSLPPTVLSISPLQDAYLLQRDLFALKRKYDGRYWTFGDSPTTVALPDNRFAKSLDSFRDHVYEYCEDGQRPEYDTSRFDELLKEYKEAGIPRPSGYADVFHERFYSPRILWSINAGFADCLTGGWQWCDRGVYRGVYHKYDITSAYLWAGAQGMPDTATFRKSRRIDLCKGDVHGLFRVELDASKVSGRIPAPFDRATECIATDEEINRYRLPVSRVLAGVVWNDTVSGDPIVRAVRAVSFWKQAARAYWGRWAQTTSVMCHCRGKTWRLGNPALNTVWAHTIVSRVKMRLWEASKNAVHVYVDSVITPDELPVGPFVGDWRLEETYQNGVVIKGPGQYGDRTLSRLERMAGVPRNSPKRNIVIQ